MTTPVICDLCAAQGLAGDPAFAGIPDILDFAPVPRRAHANGWTDAHQRAFIAALAITGSAGQAARTIGRHAFGAERLRTARGGRGFAQAWDAALDIARQRELARVHENLAGLAKQRAERDDRPQLVWETGEDDDDGSAHREHMERKDNLRGRMIGSRRLYLRAIADQPEMRSAWEVLVGPTDWDKARNEEPQADEPEWGIFPSSREPGMVLTANVGYLPFLTEGEGPPTFRGKAYDAQSAEAKAGERSGADLAESRGAPDGLREQASDRTDVEAGFTPAEPLPPPLDPAS